MTDGAAFMEKAGMDLKAVFPNVLHVTCIAHGLMRVAELVKQKMKLLTIWSFLSKTYFLGVLDVSEILKILLACSYPHDRS